MIRLCKCGCGSPTKPAVRTNPRLNAVKGMPTTYLRGHHRRTNKAPACGYIVDPVTSCWNWALSLDRGGYGKITIGGRKGRAHRLIYERAKGPIPDGLDLDHTCRNRACVNPAHLEPVTQTVNNRRSRATKLTAAQVVAIRSEHGPQRSIAKKYGTSQANVHHIKSGETWRDV